MRKLLSALSRPRAEAPAPDQAVAAQALSAEQLAQVAGGINPQPVPPIIDRF